MRIQQLTRDSIDDVYCCLGERGEAFKEEISESLGYMRKKLEHGWLAYAAYEDDGMPMAMAIILPPSDRLSPVKGEGVYYLHCLDINKERRNQKIGSALLEKILADVRALGAKGLATDSYGDFWMPSAFFKKKNFEEIQSFSIHSLLLKKFTDRVHVEFVEEPYRGDLPESGIQVDIQYGVFCPFMIGNFRRAKEIVRRIEPSAKLRERMIDTEEDVERWGGSGLYVNGQPVSAGPIDEEGLRKALEEAKRIRTRGPQA